MFRGGVVRWLGFVVVVLLTVPTVASAESFEPDWLHRHELFLDLAYSEDQHIIGDAQAFVADAGGNIEKGPVDVVIYVQGEVHLQNLTERDRVTCRGKGREQIDLGRLKPGNYQAIAMFRFEDGTNYTKPYDFTVTPNHIPYRLWYDGETLVFEPGGRAKEPFTLDIRLSQGGETNFNWRSFENVTEAMTVDLPIEDGYLYAYVDVTDIHGLVNQENPKQWRGTTIYPAHEGRFVEDTGPDIKGALVDVWYVFVGFVVLIIITIIVIRRTGRDPQGVRP